MAGDEESHRRPGYRAAHPKTRAFTLHGASSRLAQGGAVLVGGLSVLAGPKLLWPIGGIAAAAGLARLLDGAPSRLVVAGDQAVVQRLLRPRAQFALSASHAQLLPEELVLVAPAGTFAIEARSFAPGELAECVRMLRQACARFVEKPMLRPPR